MYRPVYLLLSAIFGSFQNLTFLCQKVYSANTMKKELSYLEAHYGTQQKTAEALGVSLRTYHRWRNGNMPDSRKLFIRLLVKDLRFKAA